MSNEEMDVAKTLLEAKCVQISFDPPFTYASGLKGPIYCDNRLLISNVAARDKIIRCMVEMTQLEEFDFVACVATSGIPFGSWLAWELKKPLIYIRPEAKSHGKKKSIEGEISAGKRVLLVEDLVNQGKSIGKVLEILKNEKIKVVSGISIVHYEMEAASNIFKKYDVKWRPLTTFSSIVNYSLESGDISSLQGNLLRAWHKDPAGYLNGQ